MILVYGPQSTVSRQMVLNLNSLLRLLLSYSPDSQKKAGLVSSFSVVYHLGVGPLGVVELSTRIVLALVGMRPKIITLSLND